jgi:hypothetical protein
MSLPETQTFMYPIASTIVFILAFLAGDIAGIIIEARTTRRWRDAANKIGFEFIGSKLRCPALSEFFLPKLSRFRPKESPFYYGEALNTLKGTVQGFEVAITDFTVWNLYMRGPLIFRGVVCLVSGEGINLPEQIGLVKPSSIFLAGFGWNRLLRPYDFPYDKEFSKAYVVFGRPVSPPWIFGPELRRFCVEHRRDMDVFFADRRELILLWPDKNPERFSGLVDAAIGIMTRLADSVPNSDYKMS